MKIGQEFKVQQDKEIESLFGDETLKIKKGDKAIQLKDRIHYLSGEAAGFFEYNDNNDKSYDVKGISKRLVNNLLAEFPFLNDEMSKESVSKKDIINSIASDLENYI